jgi:hypothetical protein
MFKKMSGGNSPPGYEILATETIHAQSKTLLVGTGNVLAHVSDGHVILTSDDGTKTAKVSFPSLTKKTATCLDVELVNERPEIVVGFADGSVEAVSGTRGSSFTSHGLRRAAPAKARRDAWRWHGCRAAAPKSSSSCTATELSLVLDERRTTIASRFGTLA